MDPSSFKLTVHPRHYKVLGMAILRDYTLAFTLNSVSRAGGVADVIPVQGDYVEGILYNLEPAALPPLDEREGVSMGLYQRQNVTVEYHNKRIEAMTYTVVKKSDIEIPPSIEYAQLIYNGAVQYLSFAYQKKLLRLLDKKFGINHFHHSGRTHS